MTVDANRVSDDKLPSAAEVFRSMHNLLEGIAQIAENHGFTRGDDLQVWLARSLRRSPSLSGGEPHADDLAVDRFASAMKAKMAKKRGEGRGGWENKDDCSAEFLSSLLHDHVIKGDPVDVANLAMMLHQRDETILQAASPAPLEGVTVKPLEWDFRAEGFVRGEAECILGLYRIAKSSITGKWFWSLNALDGPCWSLELPTCEATKAAAQADYEARILSAIVGSAK